MDYWKSGGQNERSDTQGVVVEFGEMKIIRYHGTPLASVAKAILVHGFVSGTFFSHHLEDALGYGGKYIFEVVFEEGDTQGDGWQFIAHEHISPERIVSYSRYKRRIFINRQDLRDAIFEEHDEHDIPPKDTRRP